MGSLLRELLLLGIVPNILLFLGGKLVGVRLLFRRHISFLIVWAIVSASVVAMAVWPNLVGTKLAIQTTMWAYLIVWRINRLAILAVLVCVALNGLLWALRFVQDPKTITDQRRKS